MSIKQWNVDNGNCIQTFPNCHDLNITALDVSLNSNQVASGSRDYFVKVWDVSIGKCLSKFSAKRNVVTCIKYSCDSNMIYQGSEDLCIRGWDVRSAEDSNIPTQYVSGYVYFPTCINIHNAYPHIIASGCKGFNGIGCEVKLHDIRSTLKPIIEWSGHTHDVTDCCYACCGIESDTQRDNMHPDLNNILITCSKDGSIALWDVLLLKRVGWVSGLSRHFTSIKVIRRDIINSVTNMAAALGAFVIGAYDGSLSFCAIEYSNLSSSDELPFMMTILYSTPAYVPTIVDIAIEG